MQFIVQQNLKKSISCKQQMATTNNNGPTQDTQTHWNWYNQLIAIYIPCAVQFDNQRPMSLTKFTWDLSSGYHIHPSDVIILWRVIIHSGPNANSGFGMTPFEMKAGMDGYILKFIVFADVHIHSLNCCFIIYGFD